jgi:hypothetical protein
VRIFTSLSGGEARDPNRPASEKQSAGRHWKTAPPLRLPAAARLFPKSSRLCGPACNRGVSRRDCSQEHRNTGGTTLAGPPPDPAAAPIPLADRRGGHTAPPPAAGGGQPGGDRRMPVVRPSRVPPWTRRRTATAHTPAMGRRAAKGGRWWKGERGRSKRCCAGCSFQVRRRRPGARTLTFHRKMPIIERDAAATRLPPPTRGWEPRRAWLRTAARPERSPAERFSAAGAASRIFLPATQ